ncbi:hypothetical protein [Azospirillum sp.]|uniref:hypothetical protein n=1 Tax=Azospirillum sp. TaxID=34012 RepID=UPI002D5A5277|nr:hypothetical protein [Azospirillum sp.]HYF87388.1 hypothetical protein [Azospirillum sp.]
MSLGVPSPPDDFFHVEPWQQWRETLVRLHDGADGIQKRLLSDAIADADAEIGRIKRYRAGIGPYRAVAAG